MTDLAERYLATWNETEPVARRKLIEDLFAENASYIDPMVEVYGRDQIDAAIGAVQAQFPDFQFTSIGEIDAHHRQARFSWALGPAGVEPIVIGFDVAMIDDAGRITTVLGFLDKAPA